MVAPSILPFSERHLGPRASDVQKMLEYIGIASLDELLAKAVPDDILVASTPLPALPDTGDAGALSERQALELMSAYAARTPAIKPMLGLGYYPSHMPEPISLLILQNPSWYTAYTPYQPEISQGRLEMLLNFQTMVASLCGLPMANASLLDEATAAAEAMTLFRRTCKSASTRFLVDADLHPQVLDVLATRARPQGIELVIGDCDSFSPDDCFGALLGYPGSSGKIGDLEALVARLAEHGVPVATCTDLLALCLLRSPGDLGFSVAIGSSQRFGLPLGAGGPHAAFIAFREEYVRNIPGRIVGISRDTKGRPSLRLALQTREQHIRRDKATSNICTAQVLPAVLAAAFAVYHGPLQLTAIARHTHDQARKIAGAVRAAGMQLVHETFFDTLRIKVEDATTTVAKARGLGLALLRGEGWVGLSCDETTTDGDVENICKAFGVTPVTDLDEVLPPGLLRSDQVLPQAVFHKHRSEHGFMRYVQRLARRDIALDRSMIPLGSCTMKLNAATEMSALTWPGFANIHPFSPLEDQVAITAITDDLGAMLKAVTGFAGISLQPNAGSQGEYAGLLAIRSYHEANGGGDRNICLIPTSAHGTNPASAKLSGMDIVSIKINASGEVDIDDLAMRAKENADKLAALMITYPSTCGIYGPQIRQLCEIVHENGGQVYMDGANLNAMVGVAQPGKFGADVMHINLHKTFCVPHGGGGPGMGPIVCGQHLIDHLPGHGRGRPGQANTGAVSAAPLGSGLILLISWAFMRMMGADGLRRSTAIAVLAANYMAKRLGGAYDMMFSGANGLVAHEFILDARKYKKSAGVTVEDIAKRLIDLGFHAPTVSFPLAGVLMIEPTESEPLDEMERFCEAMLLIREEIARIEKGEWSRDDNPLRGAPHTWVDLLEERGERAYSALDAACALPWLSADKYWPPISRVDQVHGDRNLKCVLDPDVEL